MKGHGPSGDELKLRRTYIIAATFTLKIRIFYTTFEKTTCGNIAKLKHETKFPSQGQMKSKKLKAYLKTFCFHNVVLCR